MTFTAHEFAVWIAILFFLIGGLNQGFAFWKNLTGKMVQRSGANAERVIVGEELDARFKRLNDKVEALDRRVRRIIPPLSKLIGVIAAREKIDIALPSEEDAS